MSNYAFLATSLDGFMARLDNSIDWLTSIPDPDPANYGYDRFIAGINAMVMGRNTFDFVKERKPWPYPVPVYVLSRTLKQDAIRMDNVYATSLQPPELVRHLNEKGLLNLYIDGGKTIQGFLQYNLIDEITITRIPVLIGSGFPLFGPLSPDMHFQHVDTAVFENGLVKTTYRRI